MLLALETSNRFCAACVMDTPRKTIIASHILDIGKGHSEHIMGVIKHVLDEAEQDYKNLTSIAVCVGPGSFTGIRVGLATAIGLSIALNIPIVGVSSLQALSLRDKSDGEMLCVMNAGRGDVYMQNFSSERYPLDAIQQIPESQITLPEPLNITLLPDISEIAIAALNPRMCVAAKPLYIRKPDAKPQESYTYSRSLRL
jgi:tRNA threonylcarbamoyladenosine biosynthesis protein TsaB